MLCKDLFCLTSQARQSFAASAGGASPVLREETVDLGSWILAGSLGSPGSLETLGPGGPEPLGA